MNVAKNGNKIKIIIGIIIALPHTSFYKNIKIHLDFLGINSVGELITDIDMIDRFIFSWR